MAGKKLMFVVSLSSIQPHKCHSSGRGSCVPYCGYAARLLDDYAVEYSEKSDFFR
jgi:hypothetical protein